jgi:predicted neuraminidase
MNIHDIEAPDAAYLQCHASTLVELPDGSLLVSWFAGTHEKHDDVAIWGCRCVDGEWETPVMWAKIDNIPHWNPVLHYSTGEVTLFFKVGLNCSHWATWVMRSDDAGITWSDPKELVPGDVGGRGPVKNKCIELSDGAWLAPASNEIGTWQAFVDRSEDSGRTWKMSEMIDQPDYIVGKDKNGNDVKFGVIQPTLWESEPDKVHMLLRSSCGKICRSDSDDGGRIWCKVYETDIPNNNSGIDLVRMADETLLLVYNPVAENWGARWPITLSKSTDNGLTWKKIIDLDTEPREYSYPAIIALKDGGIALSYTWNRTKIVVKRLSVDEF